MTEVYRKYYWLFWVLTMLVYCLGLFIDVMNVDAAQYASIASEMLQKNSFLEVYNHNKAYLDKPPLLFWLSAFSFSIFGVNTVAYKLPSVVFSFLAFYATYRFAKLYYSKQIAQLSALILATTQALILINNDVRTDTILLANVIIAVWLITEYIEHNKWKHLIAGSVAIGLAMLTKGPIGLMLPVLAFTTHWVLKKQWNNFVRWEWLIVVFIVGIVLLPMLLGLYRQFGKDGLYFYFWAQSFGRLTGDNPFIQGQAKPQPFSPFFFTHTFLWSFLPWSLFAVIGLGYYLFKRLKKEEQPEYLTLGGIVLPLIALSLSEYKLPHYIFIFYPFAAIISARFILHLTQTDTLKLMYAFLITTQKYVSDLLVILAIILSAYCFKANLILLIVIIGLGVVSFLVVLLKSKTKLDKLVMPSLIAILVANVMVNAVIYPQLLKYQPAKKVGSWYKANGIKTNNFYVFNTHSHALDFYTNTIVNFVGNVNLLNEKTKPKDYVLVKEESLTTLEQNNFTYTFVDSFERFPVTLLNLKFINPNTRHKTLKKYYLIQKK